MGKACSLIMNVVNLVFPNQLFKQYPLINEEGRHILIEEQLFFNQFCFHKLKLVFHRSSMRCYYDQLKSFGLNLNYIESNLPTSDVRTLIKNLSKEGVNKINIIDPVDDWLIKRITRSCNEAGVVLNIFENPSFINKNEELSGFFKPSKKKFFQTSFYKGQRERLNILIDKQGNPQGGKWSYDSENRKKYPRNKKPPNIKFPEADNYWVEAMSYVGRQFLNNPGEADQIIYPKTYEEAEDWLDQFLEERFNEFGPYEDAMVSKEIFLNHSVLSPLINAGLLLPQFVVTKAIGYAESNDIAINSLEGFVRQIIGWREFIRGIYICKGSEARNRNYWGFDRKMPACFYNATTGIPPVDDVINKVLKTGYCHHIERLMVLGNFMLLCEIEPDEVYSWFMELFIDAYDWVMVPNVYGMSQFADGGLFATKPYISGSNYIIKMSDYKKGEWQKTWDGLFWRFMHINRSFFLKNPRLSMLVKLYDKMPVEKQEAHLNNAKAYLLSLDT